VAREVGTVLTVARLLPDLLGTYGDGGNALVLAERARRRGIESRIIDVGVDQVPDASIYVVGGGEDGPQRLGVELLRASSFPARARDGAPVFAVCAGLQLLGSSFAVEGDDEYDGLGLVDAVTRRGAVRSVGDLVVRVGEHTLVGFENHGGVTTLGRGLEPLGPIVRGVGNDGAVDGFRTPSIWATYAHGPALAMNPWLADEVLAAVLGYDLEPLSTVADQLYRERISALSR
jgi:lipid II isoglutaminyl synthase (glutamine-hydrolysing)